MKINSSSNLHSMKHDPSMKYIKLLFKKHLQAAKENPKGFSVNTVEPDLLTNLQ